MPDVLSGMLDPLQLLSRDNHQSMADLYERINENSCWTRLKRLLDALSRMGKSRNLVLSECIV